MKPKWLPPESAPKIGTFLADFGWPWPVVTTWCEVSNKWAVAEYQRDHTNNDAWFETGYEEPDSLRAWMPLPATPPSKLHPRPTRSG